MAIQSRAAGVRLALVARCRQVLEVDASSPLEQVSADRRDVAQLPGGAGQNRLRKHRIAAANRQVGGQIGIANGRANPETPVRESLDLIRGQAVHVDEQLRRRHLQLHQIDEIRAGAKEHRIGRPGNQRDRAGPIARPLVTEGSHRATSAIAVTMLT